MLPPHRIRIQGILALVLPNCVVIAQDKQGRLFKGGLRWMCCDEYLRIILGDVLTTRNGSIAMDMQRASNPDTCIIINQAYDWDFSTSLDVRIPIDKFQASVFFQETGILKIISHEVGYIFLVYPHVQHVTPIHSD
jgi:hypothetical protein